VIEEILPADVAVATTREDILDIPLFPQEEALVARAVEKRRREFTTARACARAALLDLGLSPQPILSGERGAPLWPAGVVGSITHCDGYRACVVAHDAVWASIGIDAERNEPVPDGLLGDIALARERELLGGLARERPRSAGTACCSASRSPSTRPGFRWRTDGSASKTPRSRSTRRDPSPPGCSFPGRC
jgi:4'-phosphopantetheinyl transferase EntD